MTLTGRAGETALVLLAAFHHPDKRHRVSVQGLVRDWIESLRSDVPHEIARKILSDTHGTAIEPFALSPANQRLAACLIRAWAAETRAPHLRIVSEETVGSDGGLLLEPEGDAERGSRRVPRVRYVERFVFGVDRKQPENGWVFLPSMLKVGLPSEQPTNAIIELDGQGAVITLPPLARRTIDGHLARHVQRETRIYGSPLTLDRVGLRAEATQGGLALRTGSPEALIRFVSLCHQARVVQIPLPFESWLQEQLVFRLSFPTTEPLHLPTRFVTSAEAAPPWLDADLPDISVPAPLRLAISTACPVHPTWLRETPEIFLEAVSCS